MHKKIIKRRQLKGTAREEMKKSVQKEGVSNTFYENIYSLSDTEMQAGNLTNAPSKQVLQSLKKDGNDYKGINKDTISEVMLTGEILRDEDTSSKLIFGYIQFLSILPFSVILFTEATIQLLRKAIVQKTPLHLDATGSVVRKVSGQKKPIFYYALVMRESSGKSSPIIPVAELLTNSNTTVNISHFLGRVKEASIQLGSRTVSPSRIEVDFSWPLMNSILLVFNSENMIKYLLKCWGHLTNNHKEKDHMEFTVVHICAFHMIGIIKQKLSTMNADKRLKEFGKFCFALLQNSTSVNEANDIYTSICRIFNSRMTSESVERSLVSIKNRIAILPEKITEEAQDEDQFTVCYDEAVPIVTESTIRKSSPFESHFKNVKHMALSEVTQKGLQNEYFSPEILEVFETYMYLYPLWSGAMLEKEGITRDTNADVENWFGVVKNSILQKKKNVPASLFIRKLHVQIRGRTAESSLPFNKKPTQEKNIENIEEVWRKTPQKVEKSKYFNSPKSIPTTRKKAASSTTGEKKEIPKKTDDVRDNLDKVNREKNYETQDEEDSLPKLYRRKSIPSLHRTQKIPLTKGKNLQRQGHFQENLDNCQENIYRSSNDGETIDEISQPGPSKTHCDKSGQSNTSATEGSESHVHRLGIRNSRNNCWLNSTLQSFTPFMALFQKVKQNTENVLFDTCRDKILSLWSPSKCRNITVDDVLDILNSNPEYRGKGAEQQDPALLFNELFRELSLQENVNKLVLRYQHSCCRCKQISQSEKEDVFVLSTEIPCAVEEICIEDCILEFFKEEVVEKYCGRCQRNNKHIRTSQICQIPDVLILQLKRFTPQLRKLQNNIFINRRIVFPSNSKQSFQIKAVQHIHFFFVDLSFVNNDSTWFVCNDTVVQQKAERYLDDPSVTKNCYILVYERNDIGTDVLMDMYPHEETEDVDSEIEFFQKPMGSNATKLRKIGFYQIGSEDLLSLQNSNWITDQVVNAYLHLVQCCRTDVAMLDSFWLEECRKKGVMEIKKISGLESKRLLLVPIHKPAHWGLVVAYIQEGYFILVDTLKAFGDEVATVVRQFLLRHKIISKRNKLLERKFKPPVAHMNHCGPYILHVAKNEALQKPTMTKWMDMLLVRKDIKEELLGTKIIEDL